MTTDQFIVKAVELCVLGVDINDVLVFVTAPGAKEEHLSPCPQLRDWRTLLP
jgi:hypothetical protein